LSQKPSDTKRAWRKEHIHNMKITMQNLSLDLMFVLGFNIYLNVGNASAVKIEGHI
jgi:hypothetical protein